MREIHDRLGRRFTLKIEPGNHFSFVIDHIFSQIRSDFGQRTVGVGLGRIFCRLGVDQAAGTRVEREPRAKDGDARLRAGRPARAVRSRTE